MKDPKPNQVTSPAVAQTSPGKPIQRWSAARKRDVVLRLLRGESIEAVARQVGIEPYRLEQWRERALAALESALKERPQTPGRTGHGERTAAREDRSPGGWRAFSPAKVAQMSAAISPATGRSYGVQRVCRMRALPRSSFYHAANRNQAPLPPARRGPAPPVGEPACWPRSRLISRTRRSA